MVAHFAQVIISLNGSQAEINDRQRGSGSFQQALATVTRLEEAGAQVQVAVVVTQQNAGDVSEMRRRFESMGVPVRFQSYYSLGRGSDRDDLLIDGNAYFAALQGGNRDGPMEPGLRLLHCGIGGGTLSVDAGGTVYPCHLMHFPGYALGNLRREGFGTIRERITASRWQCDTVDDIPACRECFLRYIYVGQCRARAVTSGDCLDAPDPFCDYFKKTTLEFLFSAGEWQPGTPHPAS